MPTWLITGCSTGLGRHLAEAVLARGYNAVVTARDAVKVQDLVDAYPNTGLALALDVTDDAQVTSSIVQVSPQVAGTVVNILVDDNQVVKRDQLIAELDPATFETAVQQARANLALARPVRAHDVVQLEHRAAHRVTSCRARRGAGSAAGGGAARAASSRPSQWSSQRTSASVANSSASR